MGSRFFLPAENTPAVAPLPFKANLVRTPRVIQKAYG